MISSVLPVIARHWLRRTLAGALLPMLAVSAARAETYLQSVNQTGSGDWHTPTHWNTNGADTPAGSVPASINSNDHFVASRDGWNLRTPVANSTFLGGSLTLGGTAQLVLTGGGSAISTVPALTTTGGAIVGGGVTRNFSADTLTAASGSASFTSTTGGVINLFVGDLVGSGNLTISGPGKLVPSIDQAAGYTGVITVHNGATLHVLTAFDIGGRLVVNPGGNVILDDNASVAALTVAGTAQPAGTYTASTLGSGFTGSGQLVVSATGGSNASAEVIVDNLDATFTGAWVSNTHVSGYYGVDYHHDNNTGKGAKTAQFTPSLTAAGSYEIFVRWTAAWNRATNVPVAIVHTGGTANVTVNQQQNNNAWVSVGTYDFAAGSTGSVTLGTAGTNGHVIADAVRFLPATGTPPPPPPASDPALVVNYDFPAGHTLASKNGWSFANPNWALSPLPGGGGNALPFTFNGENPGEYGWSEMRFGMPAAPEEFWMRLRLHIPENYHHRFDSYIEVQNAQSAGWQVGDILRGADGVSQGVISHLTSTTVYLRGAAMYYYDHVWKGTITNVTRSNTRTSTKRGIWPANNKLLAIWSDGYSAAGDGSTIIWQTDLWDSLDQSSITVGYTVGDQTVTGTPASGGIVITEADHGTYMDIIFNGKYSTSKGAANGVIRTWVRKQGATSYTRRINITNAVLNKSDGLSPALQSWRAGYLMGWSNSGFDQTTTFHLSKIEVYNAMPAVLAPQ